MDKHIFDKKLFKNAILLMIELAGEDGMGAVKLNKCLIISDALHYALYKESLTGASYIKHKYGPVLGKDAYNLFQKLIGSRDIEVFDEMISPDVCEKNHYLCPGVSASKSLFSDEQIKIISWAVSTVKDMSAQELSDVTHDRSYHKTAMFHEINLEDVFSWKVADGPVNNFSGKRPEINFDELNTIVQRKQATVN